MSSSRLLGAVRARIVVLHGRLISLKMMALFIISVLAGNPVGAIAQTSGVFTYHNDIARTGQNLQETVLTPANVNTVQFGKLFSLPVDGYIYAQPLYMANLMVAGKSRNVVFVATEHDSVYAFDADNPGAAPLWHTSFIDAAAGVTTVDSITDTGCDDLVPEIGITSTPVIDSETGTLYVVAKTKENGAFVQRIHALGITTGADVITPVEIQATVPGTGDGSDGNGNVAFDPLRENQRAALLLSNGVIYIAFASHCDNGPYHGWVLGYDAKTLNLVGVFNATPNGGLGGIWQSGGGPAADASGNIYVITGNGTFDADTGGSDFGDSFLKLAGGTLSVSDYFTPYNQADLEAIDADLGSGAPLLLPDQSVGPRHLMVSAGKEGTIYVLNRDAMGQFQSGSDSQIVQSLPGALGSLFDSPAYFESTVYFAAEDDTLKAFTLNDGQLALSGQSTTTFGFPGATPVISANGSNNGIVWALQTDQYDSGGPAVLHAYTAADVSVELYNSSEDLARDNPGPAVKFSVPTVVNGKVFVGSQNQLSIFGLPLDNIEVAPTNPSIVRGTLQQFTATGTFSDSTTQDLTTAVTWSSSSPGTATISNAAGSEGLASAVAIGTTTITATLGSVSGTTDLMVTDANGGNGNGSGSGGGGGCTISRASQVDPIWSLMMIAFVVRYLRFHTVNTFSRK